MDFANRQLGEDALPGFREGGIVVQILCALPQAIASESSKVLEQKFIASISKTLRFGLDVSTADEKESIPYPQRPCFFFGEIFGSQGSIGHHRVGVFFQGGWIG